MSTRSPTTPIAWILWGAFVLSHLTFVAVGQLSAPESALPPDELQPLVITLSGVAVGIVVFSLTMAPRVFSRSPYLTFSLLRYAFAESVTMFGLVLALMGADWRIPVTFAAFGLLLHALAAPTAADERRHERGRD
jgi:hypothetical protein